ncbi:MAG TPA: DinB family protein [Planctomycetota bacterium]|nr:DinB family protein [Planctomycetota bacterium]
MHSRHLSPRRAVADVVMSKTQQLFPYDAMWREVGCAYRALELVRADLKAAVAGLAQDDLDRDPGHGAAPISALLAHCGAVEAWYVTKVWRRESPPDAWRPVIDAGALHKGPKPAGMPAERILAGLDAIREASRLALMKATDPDMDRAVVETKGGATTLRWILHHLLEHEAQHLGQIVLLRRLFGKPLKGT